MFSNSSCDDIFLMSFVPSIAKSQSGGSDYSTTNVQVANVDEPDYIKNDSKYA